MIKKLNPNWNNGLCIMIWGAINYDGPLMIKRIEESITSDVYIKVLDEFFSKYPDLKESHYFMDDNAKPHRSWKLMGNMETRYIPND